MYQKFWYKLFWYRIIWQMYSWLKIIKWTVSRHVRVMRIWCWSGPSNKGRRVRQWHKSFLFWAYFRPKMETQNELLGRARRWVSLCNSFKNCIIFFSQRVLNLFSLGSGQIVHIITHMQRLFLKSWQNFLKI